jgi:uncharacterized membrane protein YgcG
MLIVFVFTKTSRKGRRKRSGYNGSWLDSSSSWSSSGSDSSSSSDFGGGDSGGGGSSSDW